MRKYALILAGGTGTRLWPISTSKTPKQVLPLISPNPIIIDTIDRIKDNFSINNIFVVTSKEQSNNIYKCTKGIIPSQNIIIEPISNGTAACILYSAMRISELYGNGVISIFSADHYIDDKKKWSNIVSMALNYAEKNDFITTIGIVPTEANTNYGYILKDNKIFDNFYTVKQFVEKPNKDNAEKYIESGKYLWNSGNFIIKLSLLIEMYKKLLPDMYRSINSIKTNNWNEKYILKTYSSVENISIDYGILEKTNKIVVIQAEIIWNDVGTLRSLLNVLNKDEKNNYSNKKSLMIETNNTFVYSNNNFVITLGIDNGVIIENNGVIIVTTNDKLEEIKKLANNNELKMFL